MCILVQFQYDSTKHNGLVTLDMLRYCSIICFFWQCTHFVPQNTESDRDLFFIYNFLKVPMLNFQTKKLALPFPSHYLYGLNNIKCTFISLINFYLTQCKRSKSPTQHSSASLKHAKDLVLPCRLIITNCSSNAYSHGAQYLGSCFGLKLCCVLTLTHDVI